jgi:hypothetical protein
MRRTPQNKTPQVIAAFCFWGLGWRLLAQHLNTLRREMHRCDGDAKSGRDPRHTCGKWLIVIFK